MIKITGSSRNDLVVRSNALINAIFDLGINELRLLAFICSRLDYNKNEKPTKPVDMELSVNDFAELFNLSTNSSYALTKEIVIKLQKKVIEFQDGKDEISVAVISKGKYRKSEGRVWLRIDEDIVPHIIGLKKEFTGYKIKDVYQFKTATVWRIYELLAQYKNIGKRKFEIDEFKIKVGISGYDRVADLQHKVIKPAIQEINKVSDLIVNYEKIKRGRKITGFLFYISKKQTSADGPVIDLKKKQGQKVEKKLNLGNFNKLDIFHDKTIRELAPEDQRKAMYRALKRVGVHDGPAKKIADAVIAQELDYKDVIIEKIDVLHGYYMNLKKKDSPFSAYVVGSLYSQFKIEKAQN